MPVLVVEDKSFAMLDKDVVETCGYAVIGGAANYSDATVRTRGLLPYWRPEFRQSEKQV